MATLKRKICEFESYLCEDEKSNATIEKYIRDVKAFVLYSGPNLEIEELTKEMIVKYKQMLTKDFQPSGVNSRLVAINRFLKFVERFDCCVKLLKIQRQIFANEDRELTVKEYRRLIHVAGKSRTGCIMQTICGTGIRISELRYITVEAVNSGKAIIACKGKNRTVFLPTQVRKLLKAYIKKHKIQSGVVFVTRSGKPVDRSNVWKAMKSLCAKAGVSKDKVFPHNLRHLFARTFYAIERDIVRLADTLGHSSINTTRIYTVESGKAHQAMLEKVNKILITT